MVSIEEVEESFSQWQRYLASIKTTEEQSMKYRKKPVVIEAMQIPPPGYQYAKLGERLETWLRSNGCNFSIRPDAYILIHTLEGTMEGRPGDWIIRGVKGEFYPCKSGIFEATYEAVE
jgi:hypothetical protein